jgi:NTE family protein
MSEIAARMKNLQFANKSLDDLKLLKRFNDVAALMEAIEALPGGNPLQDNDAYKAVEAQGYLRVPTIFQIGPPEVPDEFDDADFSREAINARARAGENQTLKALQARQT